jgi:hypothetical protein
VGCHTAGLSAIAGPARQPQECSIFRRKSCRHKTLRHVPTNFSQGSEGRVNLEGYRERGKGKGTRDKG